MNLFKKKEKVEYANKSAMGRDLDELISEANMQGSTLLAKMMLARLTFTVEGCKLFKNSEEQVSSFLEKYPSMLMYRQEIIDKAVKFRKEHGLAE